MTSISKLFITTVLDGVVFPSNARKQTLLLKDYRPKFLLSISGKVLERLLYKPMSEFLMRNNLITPNQSGFKTGDSCVNQIIFYYYITFFYDFSIFYIFKSHLMIMTK